MKPKVNEFDIPCSSHHLYVLKARAYGILKSFHFQTWNLIGEYPERAEYSSDTDACRKMQMITRTAKKQSTKAME